MKRIILPFLLVCLLTACTAAPDVIAEEISPPAPPEAIVTPPAPEPELSDLAALYLRVLEDLWEVDSGLNQDLTYVGLDLSQTSLTAEEQDALARKFSALHGAEFVPGTYEELVEQGLITGTPITNLDSGEPDPDGPRFWEWEDGCFFTISEEAGSSPLTFDAHKWRTSLGAYFFSDCTAAQNDDGSWGGYTVGMEMIS